MISPSMATSNTTWDLMGTTVDSDNKTDTHVYDDNHIWMIVGIVFIVSTVFLALVLVVTCVKYCRKIRSLQNSETPMAEVKGEERRSKFYERFSRYVPFPKKNPTSVPETAKKETTVTRRKPPKPRKKQDRKNARKGDNYVNIEKQPEETCVTIEKETEASNKSMPENTYTVSETGAVSNDTVSKTETTNKVYENCDDGKTDAMSVGENANSAFVSPMDCMQQETQTKRLDAPDPTESKRSSSSSGGSESSQIFIHNQQTSSRTQTIHVYHNCHVKHVHMRKAKNVNVDANTADKNS